jgi:hypothetical protein
MKKYSNIHQYATCVSTGPQHLNPDPEPFGTPVGELLTVGEQAQKEHPYELPAKALLLWAFATGLTDRSILEKV